MNAIPNLRKVTVALLAVVGFSFSAASHPSTIQEKTVPKSPAHHAASHVVLITISGLGADLFQQSQASLPLLHSKILTGAVCITVEAVYPSQTFSALATLATGLLPADHGIMFSDGQTLNLERTPNAPTKILALKQQSIWEMLKQNQLTSALIGTPFSQHASQVEQNKSQFTHSAERMSPASNSTVLEKLIEQDQLIAQQAIAQWQKNPPNLLWIHFSSVEESQHLYGTASQETQKVLERLESCLKRTIEEIETSGTTSATFLVVGDHGMIVANQQFNPNVLLAQKGWLSLNAAGEIGEWKAMAKPVGGAAAIYVKSPTDEKAVEKLFREVYEKPDSPIWRIVNRQESSRLGADSKATFYLDAAPGYQMGETARGRLVTKAKTKTASGYLPQRSEMRTILLAFGDRIKVGVKPEYIRLVDIPSTIAHLFGLTPKTYRGRVLTEIITQSTTR